MKVRVELGRPEHGWMTWEIAAGERTWTLVASDVPVDSITELAGAISLMVWVAIVFLGRWVGFTMV